jgi:hypothetical protein
MGVCRSDPWNFALIARPSAVGPQAQPYKNLVDRILYPMAGLTDAEARALEERLDKML